MPSKKYNGNSPLGGTRLEGFADVELEVAKRSPKQSLTTGLVQTHNGAIHAPKRRRRTSRGTSAGCVPWKPTLVGNANDGYSIRLNAGTINGVINANWNTPISVSTTDIESGNPLYIFADVRLTLGQTTSLSYIVTPTLPNADLLDPTQRGQLPPRVIVLLGVWTGQTSCMVYNTSFTMESYEAFRQENTTGSGLSYYSWYKFKVTAPS